MLTLLQGIFLILFGYAAFIEPKWFRIRRVSIKSRRKIPRSFKILHLSDIHFWKPGAFKDNFLKRLDSLNPDLICVTGDIIDNDEGIDCAAKVLGAMKAPAGKFAVLGNHDYYDYHLFDNVRYHLRITKKGSAVNNVKLLRERLQAAGIRVLVNEGEAVSWGGLNLFISGTDDPITQYVDFPKAFRGMKLDSFNLLLTHVVDSVVDMKERNIDLVLSGHTHGGQIRLPGVGGYVFDFRLPRRYIDGLNYFENIPVYVSRGVGSGRMLTPRFLCRPEAILLTIEP